MDSFEAHKKKQLEILHELDRVCTAAGIQYYLAYGTCLGAVRHQGFIPWDDDIDVFLPLKEMNKLMENRHLFQDQFFLQCRETDEQYDSMRYALRDSTTALFTDENDDLDINHGVMIDLFVLYPYPDNFFLAHKLIIDSLILRILYLKKPPVNHGKLGRIIYWSVKKAYRGRRAEKKIKRIEKYLQNNGGKKYYSSFFGDDVTPFSCLKYPVACFRKPKALLFEDYMAPCPTDPEEVCEITYGPTYMEFPPEDKRVSRHHVLFLSCEEPYTNYRGRYYAKNE